MDIYFPLKSHLVLKCTLIYCFIVMMAAALKTVDSEVHTLINCLIVMMKSALHSSPDSNFPCEQQWLIVHFWGLQRKSQQDVKSGIIISLLQTITVAHTGLHP